MDIVFSHQRLPTHDQQLAHDEQIHDRQPQQTMDQIMDLQKM